MGLSGGRGVWQNGWVKKGDELAVFVYGTLKPGERSWAERCEGKVVEMKRARMRGRVFDFRKMGYPAMAGEIQNSKLKIKNEEAEDAKKRGRKSEAATLPVGLLRPPGEGSRRGAPSWVHGWRLVLKDAEALRGLDEWEGYQEGRSYSENEYERVRVECFAEENLKDEIRMANEAGSKKRRGLKHRAMLGEAWVYVMSLEKIAALGGVEVPGGEWTGKR
jgi:gamma-glutamylcyclotransferase (GGCT)/AIG2-like uncharacterized protein YtfP